MKTLATIFTLFTLLAVAFGNTLPDSGLRIRQNSLHGRQATPPKFTRSIPASYLRIGGFILTHARPAEITGIAEDREDGRTWVKLQAADVFTGTRYEDRYIRSAQAVVPFVSTVEYDVMDIENDRLHLRGADGSLKDNLKLPGEAREEITALFDDGNAVVVLVTSAMGEEAVTGFRFPPQDRIP